MIYKFIRPILIVIFILLAIFIAVGAYVIFFKTLPSQKNKPTSATTVKSVGRLAPGPNPNSPNQTSNIKIQTYKGTVVSIDPKEVYLEEEKANFRLFTIKNEKGLVFPAYINSKEINPSKIIERINGNNQPILLTDIKPGDNIEIEVKNDINNLSAPTNVTITVIR